MLLSKPILFILDQRVQFSKALHSQLRAFVLSLSDKEIPIIVVLLCATLLSTDAKRTIFDCEFETNFCNWTLDSTFQFFDKEVSICGLKGDITNCYYTTSIYTSLWKIDNISDEVIKTHNIPTDLKKRSENILYSENKFYFTLSRLKIHYISTSIFYSPIVHVTYEPSCLRYRYLLYGDSYLTISYLTNFHYLYEAIPLVGHASNGIFSFTYGCLNLPLIKEYKILFRVLHDNYVMSIAMIDYIHFSKGICGESCSMDTFQCDNSECIPVSRLCDGQRDCYDRTDESFCYSKYSTLNCSNPSFSKFKSNSFVSRESGIDGNVDVYLNDSRSVDCFPNQSCSISSVVFSSACLQRFQNETIQSSKFSNSSIFEFCFYLNDSVSIFCKGCFSESSGNRSTCLSLSSVNLSEHTLAILSVCQYGNFSTEYVCSRYSDNTSIVIAPCTNLTNKCASVSCMPCTSTTNNVNDDLLRLFGEEASSMLTEDIHARLMSCQNCNHFVNQSANDLPGECPQTDSNPTTANSSNYCDKCGKRPIPSVSECEECVKRSSSNENVCLDCLDADVFGNCIQCRVTCYPFCPPGCICFGKSYVCVRENCPSFSERITIQNVACDNLTEEDFEHKHIFKLEILNSVITNLTIEPRYNKPLFLHRLVIKNSNFSNVFIEPYTRNWLLLQSIQVYNSTMSSFRGKGLARSENRFTGSFGMMIRFRPNPPYHLAKAFILTKPQIFDLSGNALESFDKYAFDILDFYDFVNISHSGLHILQRSFVMRVLDLSYNFLVSYEHSKSFLEILYLNNNRLQSAKTIDTTDLRNDNLKIIDLSVNNITALNDGDFQSRQLVYLNLSRNRIRNINARAFLTLHSLLSLDLSHNEISSLPVGTFSFLEQLEDLHLQGNPFQVLDGMFEGLINLRILEVGFYTICCAKPRSKYNLKCISPIDEISSCDSLIAVPVLNVAIWYIAAVAAFGNISVLIYNIKHLKKKSAGAYYILTINLSCADFLMGVYLFIIAITNLHYSGRYGLSDYQWRHSIACTISGIIATLSSEVSAFIVFLITLDRFIAVKYPFSNFKLTRKTSLHFLLTAWILSILLALIPLLPSVNLDNFYAQSGICIYLPLSASRRSGWEYSMIMFVGVNFLLFLGILIGQISIFMEVVKVGKNVRSTKTNQREASLAGTLFAIVLTDVLCWIPIGSIGMLTFLGIDVDKEVYPWMVVVVLPINSALNPILYTLTSVLRNKNQKEAVQVMQLKTQLAMLKARVEYKGAISTSTDTDTVLDRISENDHPEVNSRNQSNNPEVNSSSQSNNPEVNSSSQSNNPEVNSSSQSNHPEINSSSQDDHQEVNSSSHPDVKLSSLKYPPDVES